MTVFVLEKIIIFISTNIVASSYIATQGYSSPVSIVSTGNRGSKFIVNGFNTTRKTKSITASATNHPTIVCGACQVNLEKNSQVLPQKLLFSSVTSNPPHSLTSFPARLLASCQDCFSEPVWKNLLTKPTIHESTMKNSPSGSLYITGLFMQ